MRKTETKCPEANSLGQHKDPIEAAMEYGIDITMLEDNLKRSPAERIRRHQIAFETYKILRRAKRI